MHKITVETLVNAPIEKAWEYWTNPTYITQWNFANDDWQCPSATNDLRTGGKFSSRMEAKDGSFGFDFEGIYDEVKPHQHIAYTMEDGRTASIRFTSQGDSTKITETFDAEATNPEDLQRAGWQAILDNYKKLVDEA